VRNFYTAIANSYLNLRIF